MAAAPRFKVYNPEGEYVAACKYPEDAAAVVAAHGPGAQIRDGHTRVVSPAGRGETPRLRLARWGWHEGHEDAPAGESYDVVAQTVVNRVPDPRSAEMLGTSAYSTKEE